jgi:hypothetical protein
VGKLIILVVLFIVVVAFLGLFLSWLNNHNRRVGLGLKGSKRDLQLMRHNQTTHLRVLREIRELAADSFVTTGDPMFESIMNKADQVLDPKEKLK